MDSPSSHAAAEGESQLEPLMAVPEIGANNSTVPHSPLVLRPETPRILSFLNGLAVVVGLQIGSGVFSSPAQVSSLVPSPLGAVCIWLVAGAIVWAGSSTLLEFATAIPQNGGIEEYLRFCYGDAAAFIFSWVWILIAKPCAHAMVSLILAEHFNMGFFPDRLSDHWTTTGIALFSILVMTAINAMGTTAGAKAANVFFMLKLVSVASISLIGICYGIYHMFWVADVPASSMILGDTAYASAAGNGKLDAGSITAAVFGALFAYGGWENVGFIAGEVQCPEKNLPKIINTAMVTVILAFLSINVALFMVLDHESLIHTNAVAALFGQKVFGSPGRLTFSLVVIMSCLGALNANLFASARLTQQASKSGFIPSYFAKDSRNLFFNTTTTASLNKAPIALILNSSIAVCYVLAGSFRSLIAFKEITEYLFYSITIGGRYILIVRMPIKRLSYKTWWPNPLVFSGCGTLLVIQGVISQPLQGIAICGVLSIAGIAYLVFIKNRIAKGNEIQSTDL